MCVAKEVDVNLEDIMNIIKTGYYYIQNQPVKLKYSPEEFEKSIILLPDRIQSIFKILAQIRTYILRIVNAVVTMLIR